MGGPPDGAHAQHGEAERIAERNIQIWNWRIAGWTQQQIATQLGISKQRVSQICKEAMVDHTEPVIQELRAVAADKLDEGEQVMREIMHAKHPFVQGGKIVRGSILDADGNEEPGDILYDDGPKMAAWDRILKIEARRAAMFGYDAEQKINMTGSVLYELVGINPELLK